MKKILQLLKDHPSYSARKLGEVIGITPKAIEKHLAKLKAEGLIRRDGPDKGGSWIVYTLLSFCLLLFSSCGSWDTYYQTPNNGFTRIPYLRWINQQVLLKSSSDSKLETMALHSNNPANRAMAFDGLVTRRSPRCYDVLLAELTDTSSFNVQWLDLIFDTSVASYDLQATEEDSLLFVKEQRHHIDSVVLFGTGLDHLDRQPSASRLQGMNGVYERVRKLCINGDSNLLPALAEYKNPQDIPLVSESLLGDNQSDIDPETAIEHSRNALAAIMLWRDEAFAPALEEYREEKLTNGVRDYYGVKMLLQTVMAYDNEWACHYIEDMFMRCEKDRDIYSELFFETFYENNERPRFLPLVEKYGKRPFGWGGEY